MKNIVFALIALFLVLALSCAAPTAAPAPDASQRQEEPAATATAEPTHEPTPEPTPKPTPMPDMSVTSAGITDGAMDLAYGAKGEQRSGKVPTRSLPLTINCIPEGTATLALTMIDPDGGNWVHWTACNIPVEGFDCEIAENASIDWPESVVQGKNDFGPNGYGGPTPPSGVHTYVITVYALSTPLELEAGFRLKALQAAMEGKVLGEAILTGTYAK